MSSADIIAAVIAASALAFTVLVAVIGLLWRTSGQWARASAELRYLGDQVKELAGTGQRERIELLTELRRVANRQDRHEEWHAERAPMRRTS